MGPPAAWNAGTVGVQGQHREKQAENVARTPRRASLVGRRIRRRVHTVEKTLPTPSPGAVTELLRAWSDGDDGALERLMPLVEAELRRLARGLHGPRAARTHAADHGAGE